MLVNDGKKVIVGGGTQVNIFPVEVAQPVPGWERVKFYWFNGFTPELHIEYSLTPGEVREEVFELREGEELEFILNLGYTTLNLQFRKTLGQLEYNLEDEKGVIYTGKITSS